MSKYERFYALRLLLTMHAVDSRAHDSVVIEASLWSHYTFLAPISPDWSTITNTKQLEIILASTLNVKTIISQESQNLKPNQHRTRIPWALNNHLLFRTFRNKKTLNLPNFIATTAKSYQTRNRTKRTGQKQQNARTRIPVRKTPNLRHPRPRRPKNASERSSRDPLRSQRSIIEMRTQIPEQL